VHSACSAQVHNTTFRSQHSLNRPDSVLVNDTLLFPNSTAYSHYTYTYSSKRSRWGDSGAILNEASEDSNLTSLSLRGDHTYILHSHWEPIGHAGSVGRWSLVDDSLICLNWFGVLTLEMSRHASIDYAHKKMSPAKYISQPIRVDHWRFVRRGKQLVPYGK
jgi:hypothetical protein